MIDYTSGIIVSLVSGTLLALGTFFFIGKHHTYVDLSTDYAYRVLVSAINFFSLSLLVYCSYNTFINLALNFNLLIDNEIKNGIFFNRFISIYISFLCLRYNTRDTPLKYLFKKPVKEHEDYEEDRSLIIISQYSIYIVTFYIIWYSTYQGISNNYTLLLAWSLIFIVDDWRIMVDYLLRDGKIIKNHERKISFFNFMIILLSIIVVAVSFNIVAVLIYCFIVIYILSFRYDFAESIFHQKLK